MAKSARYATQVIAISPAATQESFFKIRDFVSVIRERRSEIRRMKMYDASPEAQGHGVGSIFRA
jgi:hypothetical protein